MSSTNLGSILIVASCVLHLILFRFQALLPVDSTTLRYGTADGARSVHNDDAQLADCLRQAGKKLNLRTHKVHETVRGYGMVWYGMVWYGRVG